LLPAFWTEAKKRGIKVEQLVQLLSRQASIFCGLDGKKGKLASGYDADVMIWEPESSFILTESMIEHRHKVCPYTGLTLFGVVKKTIVGGIEVFDSGKFVNTNSGHVLMSTE
jgi:allantoinase